MRAVVVFLVVLDLAAAAKAAHLRTVTVDLYTKKIAQSVQPLF